MVLTTDISLKPINILVVEDNSADVRLIREVFKEGRIHVNLIVAEDGEQAISYLRKEGKYKYIELPDLILLDLNMPKKSGHELLAEMKGDDNLKQIPVIVMTISKAEEDILKSYNLHANAYIVKPVELDQFIVAVKSIENFWLTIVKLPPRQT